MSYELTGRLVQIGTTQQLSERFKRREFTVETHEEINGKVYSNYAKFQTTQNKCDLLDNYKVGETVKVFFNIKGNKWERDGNVNYITNLDAWKIEAVSSVSTPKGTPVNNEYNNPGTVDDLPF